MTAKVEAIPPGMHTVTPHLACEGPAKAIDFYKKTFDAEELMRMPGANGRLMHAALKIGDSVVMLADAFPEYGGFDPLALKGSPVTLHMYVQDADAVFKQAVEAGATVRMPLADMFWGDRYGQVTDPFGHHWAIATHIKDMTPEEMMEAMKNQAPECQ